MRGNNCIGTYNLQKIEIVTLPKMFVMRLFISLMLLTVFTVSGCDKSEVNKPPDVLPLTVAVKTGDWMITYFVNNASMDMGVTLLKFNTAGNLAATKDGTPYNGTWTETNTGGNNMLAINITTSDTKLKKANGTWKVVNITEYFIDLKDPNAANITIQLMKH